MMVGDGAGERPALDRLPQRPALLVLGHGAGDDAPLGPEERLVRRARHEVGAVRERQLEVRADQPEHVGHVVHHDRGDRVLVEERPDLGDRLGVQDHALAEHDELRAALLDELERRGDVDPVGVVGQDGEVHDRRPLGPRIARHEVLERPHRLGRQVAAPADVVVHHPADAPGLAPAVVPVEVVDHRAEHGRVGHLTADRAGLDLRGAEEGPKLPLDHAFHVGDELRPLVVEDLGVVERVERSMLRVAERRVRALEQPDHRRRRHLGRDQVDALALAPLGVGGGPLEQPARPGRGGERRDRPRRRLGADDDRPRERRRLGAQVVLDDLGLDRLAADVDRDPVAVEEVALEVREADRPRPVLAGGLGGLVVAVEDPVRHGGPARHVPDLAAVLVDLRVCSGDPAADDGDGRIVRGSAPVSEKLRRMIREAASSWRVSASRR